ncbi:MAG: NAD(P)/FAD-dependent oxidoreductase [Minwuia sp.]|nr:NAD(P)/FAD-dependent oxidoreductase [Minwuia sp.]
MSTVERVEITAAAPSATADAAAASDWLTAFGDALQRRDVDAAASLFLDDGHWRDILAFSWHLTTVSGIADIRARLNATIATAEPRGLALADGRTPPRTVKRAGQESLEVLFTFDTAVGHGQGVVRLVEDPSGSGDLKAWTLMTALHDLRDHPERLSAARAGGDAFAREFGGANWQDHRDRARAYADREPAVVVVGAGQAGLAIAARLNALGVDTLLVERNKRVGDNWRTRYHSLTLHNEVYVNHLPYMPFPPTWPVYIPKDMLANWFEFYVEAMELNCWTDTSLTSGAYDAASGTWTLKLESGNGSSRTMRPRHVIIATGVSAIPVIPDLPGLDMFRGTVMHSGEYTDGKAWSGKRALVIGTGNSAHDVAQDLHASGADVTMVQRSASYIVSLAEAQKVYALYDEGPPLDDCDLLAASFPFPVMRRSYQLSTAEMKQVDADLLNGLEARGFKLDFGEGETGFQMKYMQRGGGYYFNVGCSDLIVSGDIKLLHDAQITGFAEDGARLDDGTLQPVDLIVAATGYLNQQETVRTWLNSDVADRIGPVWGFNDGGELRNMWCRTPQPGLWFTAGSLAQCRIFSRYLALQIKACEEGLISADLDG